MLRSYERLSSPGLFMNEELSICLDNEMPMDNQNKPSDAPGEHLLGQRQNDENQAQEHERAYSHGTSSSSK